MPLSICPRPLLLSLFAPVSRAASCSLPDPVHPLARPAPVLSLMFISTLSLSLSLPLSRPLRTSRVWPARNVHPATADPDSVPTNPNRAQGIGPVTPPAHCQPGPCPPRQPAVG